MSEKWEHPIDSGAQTLLFRLSEQTEDVMDEVAAELWPGGEDAWWAAPTTWETTVHSERTYAAVQRRLGQLLRAAADAAEDRAATASRVAHTAMGKYSPGADTEWTYPTPTNPPTTEETGR